MDLLPLSAATATRFLGLHDLPRPNHYATVIRLPSLVLVVGVAPCGWKSIWRPGRHVNYYQSDLGMDGRIFAGSSRLVCELSATSMSGKIAEDLICPIEYLSAIRNKAEAFT